MDNIDIELLRRLQTDGRASWADLAAAVKLTPPAAAERVLAQTTKARALFQGRASCLLRETAAIHRRCARRARPGYGYRRVFA
mgnify:CR=1 FL=1